MTIKLMPLDSRQHRTHGWCLPTNCRFAVTESMAPVILPELQAMLAIFPLAFARNQSGAYQLVALLGATPGENVFVDEQGRWEAAYVPSCYRTYPFRLPEATVDDERRLVLCFDMRSGLYREQPDTSRGEERFFDDDGNLRPPVKDLVGLLKTATASQQITQKAVDALAASGVLEPWQLPADLAGQGGAPVHTHLYRANPMALNALDGAAMCHLRDTAALAIAYAQVFSAQRLPILRHLMEKRAAKKAPAPAAKLPDSLFAADPNGTLNFDWLRNE